MSLLLSERILQSAGELLLGDAPLAVTCQVTVESLRGIPAPTWYGYFTPVDGEIWLLPGRYRLRLDDATAEILVRRSVRLGTDRCFPFWGLDDPPDVRADRWRTPEPPAPRVMGG